MKNIRNNALKIKETVDNIKVLLSTMMDEIRHKINQLKCDYNMNKKIISDDKDNLLKETKEIKKQITNLVKTKAILERKLESDLNKMVEMEKENMNYKKTENNLKSTISVLENNLKDIKDNIESLSVRKCNLLIKNDKQLSKIIEQNAIYTKYLGIDFKSVKDNVIKIFFTIYNQRCWIILDFNQENVLIESEPKLNLDYFNSLYTEIPNFYIFIKQIRTEFANIIQ